MKFTDCDKTLMLLCEEAQEHCLALYKSFQRAAQENTERIISAFQKHRVSDSHFAGTTGYGYNDLGRDTLDRIYADVFGAEDALVRVQFVNGTHAIACALRAGQPLPPVEPDAGKYLSLIGEPYDTLRKIMPYDFVPPDVDGNPDIKAIKKGLATDRYKLVYIQRSRGYSQRSALSVSVIEELCKLAKELCPGCVVIVDNCYGEFVETREPTMVGADLIAGSLIKNPGGGLAICGGYVAGKHVLVERAAEFLTVPGIGREAGSSLGQNRLLYQGLYTAPHVVYQALMTAAFSAYLLEKLGYAVSPRWDETRYDIIQIISFGKPEPLLRFCRGIQEGSPVDSFASPEPWDMPGYEHQVVMAAGTFVQGASIELSCDAPIREPYTAYLQGGLTFEAGSLGVLTAVRRLMEGGAS